MNIPRVASGGIKLDDTLSLIEAGVNGIAVGKAIARSENPEEETKEFIKVLPKTPEE